jgi:hypothetical protein
MHLLAISLLAILAGTLMLAKFRKEALGKFFAFISWFFIVVGFILFIFFVGDAICKMSHGGKPGQPCYRHEMMRGENCRGMNRDFSAPGDSRNEGCGPKECPRKADSLMKECPMRSGADSAKMQHHRP